jgi:hypothetical protein
MTPVRHVHDERRFARIVGATPSEVADPDTIAV